MGKSSLVTLKTWVLKQDLTVHLELTLNSGSFGFHFLSMGSIGKSIVLYLFIYLKNMFLFPIVLLTQCQELCHTYLYVPKNMTVVRKDCRVSDELSS